MLFLPLHDKNPIAHIRFPYVSYTLMALTVLVFALQFFLPPLMEQKVVLGFSFIPAITEGLYTPVLPWLPLEANFITYAFLHADFWHLAFNLLFFWIFADNVEDAFGHTRFLLFFALCAAAAAFAHFLSVPQSTAPLIGASGAIAGAMGAYMVLFPHARVIILTQIIIPVPLPLPALWVLGAWGVMQLVFALTNATEPVAFWAHLGGLVTGAALAPFFRRKGVKLFGGR